MNYTIQFRRYMIASTLVNLNQISLLKKLGLTALDIDYIKKDLNKR